MSNPRFISKKELPPETFPIHSVQVQYRIFQKSINVIQASGKHRPVKSPKLPRIIGCFGTFINLNDNQVRSMWAMLISSGKGHDITYQILSADDATGSAQWVATYTFSKTGRKVINRIQANFVFANGKIARHRNSFDYYKWARQALGLKGLVLGWSTFLRKKIQQTASGQPEKNNAEK